MPPEELIRSLYQAFKAKDEARLREILADAVQWNQCAGFPGGRDRLGVDDVLDGILGTNHTLWQDFRATTTEFLTSGSTVVVLGEYSGTHSETGRSMRSAFTHVYRVEGGRVVRFDQVADTALMIAAASGEPG